MGFVFLLRSGLLDSCRSSRGGRSRCGSLRRSIPGGSGLLLCGSLCLGLRLRLGLHLEHLLKACHLVMLSHIFKDDIKLLVLKNLHMVLGRRHIVSKYLGYDLGSHPKILCDLMNSVLDHHTPFLLFPFLLFRSAAASRLRRFALSQRLAVSSAMAEYLSG